MANDFFAMISRMKYIDRWALMRNTDSENLSEHTKDTAVIAHALALIGNARLGKHLNADRAATLALYHDAHEILTGDMPTPVKYQNPDILTAFRSVESTANEKLLSMLPDDLKKEYADILNSSADGDCELIPIIKAADKLSALIKCIEERKAGNTEFLKAELSLKKTLKSSDCAEARIFTEEFLAGFELTLDQIN